MKLENVADELVEAMREAAAIAQGEARVAGLGTGTAASGSCGTSVFDGDCPASRGGGGGVG